MAIVSLVLAFIFWAVATEAEDPMISQAYPSPITVEIRERPEDMIAYGMGVEQATVVLRAPESLWQSLLRVQSDVVEAYVDLSDVEQGSVTVPVQVQVNRQPVQVVSVTPSEVTLNVEPVAEKDVPVDVNVEGTAALGFRARSSAYAPRNVTVRGPAPQVEGVDRVLITISVEDRRQSVEDDFQPVPVDETGEPVQHVEVIPRTVTVEVPVEQLGNIRDLPVNAVLTGHPAPGYRVGPVNLEPPVVTVTGRRDVVQNAPLALSTEPIPLDGASESFTRTVGLQLPEGLSVLTSPEVLVSVSIEMLESVVTLPVAPEIRGLSLGYTATVTPTLLQIVIEGPFLAIEALVPTEVEVFFDLGGLSPGEHPVTPEITLPDDSLRVKEVIPPSVIVEIREQEEID
ncbi:MAG: YbbR-like domain-containing protein [Anaerolineales bacterium]